MKVLKHARRTCEGDRNCIFDSGRNSFDDEPRMWLTTVNDNHSDVNDMKRRPDKRYRRPATTTSTRTMWTNRMHCLL